MSQPFPRSDSGPLVSVIVPVHNGAEYVGQAIESVLRQSYEQREILVIDDGSEDGPELRKCLAPFGASVKLIRQKHAGIAAALNRGLAEMRGNLFSWLSHDDRYLPGKLRCEVSEYLRHGGSGVIYSDYRFVDAGGNPISTMRLPTVPPGLGTPLLLQNTWVHGCAMLIPREAIQSVGGFDQSLRTTQDYDLFFRLARSFEFHHVAEIVAEIRVHRNQTTNRKRDVVRDEQDRLYAQYVTESDPAQIEAFSRRQAARFYGYLYRRFQIGLLPRAARAAMRRAWAGASVQDRLRLLGSAAAFNPVTAPGWRAVVRVLESLRGAGRPV